MTLESGHLIVSEVGRGESGSVFKAVEKSTGLVCTVKLVRVFKPQHSVPDSFYREWKSLSAVDHANVVQLRNIVDCQAGASRTVCLVFEYCEYHLGALIAAHGSEGLPLRQARCYMRQVLLGLSAIHGSGFAHRDIKLPNIFVTSGNVVKIGDFGLARDLRRNRFRPLMATVITPCYRSLEVLLKDGNCSFPVDIWSLACVFYEMATGQTLFLPSTASDIDQLLSIFQICGTPNPDEWIGLEDLPGFALIRDGPQMPCTLGQRLDDALPREFMGLKSLLEAMLVLDPAQRVTAKVALDHPFFGECDSFELEPRFLPRMMFPELHGTTPQCTRVALGGRRNCPLPLSKPERIRPPAISFVQGLCVSHA
jgi:serine/threonine protein kinase